MHQVCDYKYCAFGYELSNCWTNMMAGRYGPGTFTYQAGHNLILAHARAYRLYESQFKPTQKGERHPLFFRKIYNNKFRVCLIGCLVQEELESRSISTGTIRKIIKHPAKTPLKEPCNFLADGSPIPSSWTESIQLWWDKRFKLRHARMNQFKWLSSRHLCKYLYI